MVANRSLVGVIVPILACAGSAVAQPRFVGLGPSTTASAISADGRVVVGHLNFASTVHHAIRWTEASGTVDIHSDAIVATSFADAVSGDGSVVTGRNGWVWIAETGMQALSLAGHSPTFGSAVSRDGHTVAGYALNNASPQFDSFTWTAEAGFVLLPGVPGGPSSKLLAMTPGATLAVGTWSTSAFSGQSNAVLWSPMSTAHDLSVPGVRTSASAITPDGATIVGRAFVTAYQGNAVIWTAGGAQLLTNPSGGVLASLLSVTDSGDFACGTYTTASTQQYPMVWRRGVGTMDGLSALSGRGVAFPQAWFPQSFTGVTPDGRAIVGNGQQLEGSGWAAEGFVIYLCSTPDYNHDGSPGTDADIEAFFACLAGNCCATCDSADINNDGDVGTDADIEAFFRILGGRPC